jgi:hypothetical protein
VLLEIHVYWRCCRRFMCSEGVPGDSFLLVMVLKIYVYRRCWWRFMSTGDVAGDSCILKVFLEIHFFWWWCWRFMSIGGVAGDSCLLGRYAMLTGTDVSKDLSAFIFRVNRLVVTFEKTCIFSVIICLTEQHKYCAKLATSTAGSPPVLCSSIVYTQSHYMVSRYLICISCWN